MTQEEKAKAYDEAIERAKEWFNPEEPDSYTSIVESIFPELKAVKEYEDKKIRKELITHCKNIRCVTEEGAEKIANWITWLEKIGEHLKFCKTIQIGDRVTRNEGGVLVNMSQLDKIAKKRKKEGEQKQDFASQKDIPRYHIGDVLCDKSCTTLNKESQSNFEITDIRNGMYICDKCSFPISQQDEYELVAKRIEQKPADLEEFISELSKQFPDVSFAKLSRIAVRVAKWAKPCWSKEDKKHIIDIIDYLDDYYSFAKDEYKDVADGVLNEIRWLQHIRIKF